MPSTFGLTASAYHVASGDFTETFIKADGVGWGPALTWTAIKGQGQIVSNTGRNNATNTDNYMRADHDVGSDNMFARAVLVHANGGSDYGGVFARWSASGAYQAEVAGTNAISINKVDTSGNYVATLASTTYTFGGTPTLELRVTGTTVDFWINGASRLSTTDSSYASGQRGGGVSYTPTIANVQFTSFVTGPI